jgi:hypothetical protein
MHKRKQRVLFGYGNKKLHSELLRGKLRGMEHIIVYRAYAGTANQ